MCKALHWYESSKIRLSFALEESGEDSLNTRGWVQCQPLGQNTWKAPWRERLTMRLVGRDPWQMLFELGIKGWGEVDPVEWEKNGKCQWRKKTWKHIDNLVHLDKEFRCYSISSQEPLWKSFKQRFKRSKFLIFRLLWQGKEDKLEVWDHCWGHK